MCTRGSKVKDAQAWRKGLSRKRLNRRNIPREYGIQEQRQGMWWGVGRREV